MNIFDRTTDSTRPSSFAASEHGKSADRLVLIDWPSGHVTALTEYGETPRAMTFSNDGSRLAYRIGPRLQFHPAIVPARPLPTDLDVQSRTPFSFSSDGKLLWAATAAGLAIVDTTPADQATKAVLRVTSVGAGCRIAEVVREPSTDSPATLCSPAPSSNDPQILRFDTAAGGWAARLAPGASHILGFRTDGVVLYARTAGAGDEVVALTDSGPEVVRRAIENQFILDYLPESRTLVAVRGGEDTSDATELMVGPLIGELRPWLRQFPRLADLAVTSDKRWAVFVDRMPGDNPHGGGALYVAPVGSDDAQLILAASEDHSFSRPVARPRMHRSGD